MRLPRLGDASVWWDEGFAIYLARMPLLQAAYRTAFDVHPPLHYWILHYWIRLVGESEFAVRYSTVLLGILSIAVMAWAGRRILGPRSGLLAALFLALARIYVEWSQQMRMYTVATALVAAMLALTVLLCREPRPRRWLALILCGTVALYTLYIAGIVLFALGLGALVYGLFARDTWRTRLGWVGCWLGAGLAVTALYLPWLVVLARTPRPGPRIEWTIDPLTFAWAYLTVLPLGLSAYLDRYLLPTAAATLLLLVGFVAAARAAKPRAFAVLGASAMLIAPTIIYLMSLPNPIFFKPNLFVRYLLILLPVYDLALAIAVIYLAQRRRVLGFAAAALLVGLAGWSLASYYPTRVPMDDYASLTRFIAAHAQPGDEIVLYPDRDWPIFDYHNHSGLPRYGVGTEPPLATAADAARLGASLLAAHPSLWVVSIDGGHDSDPNGYLAAWLKRNSRAIGTVEWQNRAVTLYSRDPARTLQSWTRPPDHPLALPLQPGVEILGSDRAVTEVAAGTPLDVAVYWSATAPTAVGTRAVVWLADSRGWPVHAASWPLELKDGGHLRQDYPLSIPAGLPSGTYGLFVGVRGASDSFPTRGAALGSVHVDSSALTPIPAPRPSDVASFDGAIGLDRVAIEQNGQATSAALALHPGDRLTVQLSWRSLQATDRDYTAFVHLIGPTNPATNTPIWAQQDRAPGNGAEPTANWLPGEAVSDRYDLVIPANAPSGAYQIEIGLYETSDGRRAVAQSAGASSDHLIVAHSEIAP